MVISDFFKSNQQKEWTEKIRKCDWGAASFLADLLEQNKFHKTLGKGSLFIMTDGDELVSFCTLTQKDCIDDDTLFPWIGFVFTAAEYRGHRYSGELIDYACEKAKKDGYKTVYIATDHIGLYEKYDFSYSESRTDIYNEESRIYFKEIN